MKVLPWSRIFLVMSVFFSLHAHGLDSIRELKKTHRPKPSVSGHALAKGAIVTVMFDREFLQAKLPKGVDLIPYADLPPSQHPAV